MALTLNRALSHVKEWTRKLAAFPTRAHWPPCLFHTCQLEVAVEIIRAGEIKCRANVSNLICDVANQGALWNNPHAHKYVRLYFRTRNPFHLKTEGVKAIGDPYRAPNHMSIPITFAFDFTRVLTLPQSGFVSGNFAKTGAAPAASDKEFDKLPFDLIYHDSALPPDRIAEVHNWRMSEVVVGGALSLANLSCVICRTTHEERTLRHLLGTQTCPRIIVEQGGAIFMRRGMFIDEIYWSSNFLHVRFHGPTGFIKDQYGLQITCNDGQKTSGGRYLARAGVTYRLSNLPASRDAVWQIYLEDCIVYYGQVPSVSGLVSP
jgi:hypothetical protein